MTEPKLVLTFTFKRRDSCGSGLPNFSRSIIGGDPQIKDVRDVSSSVEIGDGTTVREFVTIHRSTKENEKTIVGKDVLSWLMCTSRTIA